VKEYHNDSVRVVDSIDERRVVLWFARHSGQAPDFISPKLGLERVGELILSGASEPTVKLARVKSS